MTDRFVRQHDLVPPDRLQEVSATVIGVGAIGRQVALQLAAIGIRRLQLIDFDTVELSNVTTQGYHMAEVGTLKVLATERVVREIDPAIEVATVADRFRPRHQPSEAVFCCVDAIATRAAIWQALGKRISFWADGRMLGEVVRILVVTEGDGLNYYGTTLFQVDEAQPGRCTSRSTIYTANIAAGLMLHQFTRWLRSTAVDRDLTLNLLGTELVLL